MQLQKNQYVIFPDGHKEGYLEARWSERNQSFYTFIDTEDGEIEKVFSNNIITIERKKRSYKKQNDISKMKEIFPCFETEKAYAVYDGENGYISRGKAKVYYKYYAKSICTEKNGKIYAPVWA